MAEAKETQKWQGSKTFLKSVQKRWRDSEIGNSSAVIAYYLLLSLFPLLIAIGTLLPYLQLKPATVLSYLAEVIPPNVFSTLKPTIANLLGKTNNGWLSVSALGTLWAASKSVNALQVSLNKAYGVTKGRNAILARFFSFFIIIMFLITIVLVVVIFGLGQVLLDHLAPILHFPMEVAQLFDQLKWPTTLLILVIMMWLIYYFIPNARLKKRSVVPGTLFSAVAWMFLTQFFSLYAKYFSKSVSSYGIIGSFIVFLLWLNFAATIILIGGILNAATEEMLNGEIRPKKSLWKKVVGKVKR